MLFKDDSIVTGAFLAICTTTMAQSSVIIDVESPVLAPGQSTTVTLWAAWPEGEYAMASVLTSLSFSVAGAGSWSELQLMAPMDGPGTMSGVITDTAIEEIFAMQLNFGPTGFRPDFSNPIFFWQAMYTAPAIVEKAFEFEIMTQTTQFDVYVRPDSHDTRSYLSTLTEGQATIHIIPAPAGAVVLGLGVLVAGRRRR